MIFTIQEGVSSTVAGNGGLQTWLVTDCLSAVFDVHEGSASTTETDDFGTRPPECWFEVMDTCNQK